MKALKASGVFRKYGETPVLKGLELEVEAGGFEALMGPSGCGKSTFLHLAGGLLKVDAGEIEVGGLKLTSLGDDAAAKFRRQHVGMVFQAFNLLNEKTVSENIMMPAKLLGIRVDSKRLEELAGKLGIAALMKKRPEELSGGEQQRVAIARALLMKPELVLADEPTGNLDTQAAKGICELLRELNHSESSAILVVTHDPQVAACAQKVHFLRDGVIAASHLTEGSAERVSQLYLETYRQ